jgi:putative transferase (TIGR04331 family)
MDSISRYLITTADEQTWKFDRPSIFLGEWCRRYDRKNIWKKMDAVVAEPYGLGLGKKIEDLTNARRYEEQLFPLLCDVLNTYHVTQHGKRYWRIVFGHWLRRYVDVILNRFNTLQSCLQKHTLNGTAAYSDDSYCLAPIDSYEAIFSFNDHRWNNELYLRILSLQGGISFPVDLVSSFDSSGLRKNERTPELERKEINLRWFLRKIARCSEMFSKNSDALVIGSYLPRKEEIVLQLALGQVPQFWASPRINFSAKPDRVLRNRLSELIPTHSEDPLFDVMCSLVFDLLPVCYLEGFQELTENTERLPWPRKPKFIFTSNSFDTDEVFKLWAAKNVESGAKYYVGQHGNNYGTYRYMHPAVEEITADKFLTWGWVDELPQHTPAFVFKTANMSAQGYDASGGLLLIELHAGLMLTTWDASAEFNAYFEDQLIFVGQLKPQIKEQLTIRLHGMADALKWGEKSRWEEFDGSIKLNTGTVAISKLISKSRLVVHSYDSTGILETLSQNIPTLVFWQNGFDHLRESAKPYYQVLVDTGIVHLTAESAAAKINEVWDDVDGWWMNKSIQDARKKFCDQYARTCQNPVSELKQILTSDLP